eukprot:COSAG01_NODE_33069_length_570_cov_1.997877_1_plen_90_part_00
MLRKQVEEQEPPQSVPVSLPFCVLSEHVGQAEQELPQSVPVSSPFCVLLEQQKTAAAQWRGGRKGGRLQTSAAAAQALGDAGEAPTALG